MLSTGLRGSLAATRTLAVDRTLVILALQVLYGGSETTAVLHGVDIAAPAKNHALALVYLHFSLYFNIIGYSAFRGPEHPHRGSLPRWTPWSCTCAFGRLSLRYLRSKTPSAVSPPAWLVRYTCPFEERSQVLLAPSTGSRQAGERLAGFCRCSCRPRLKEISLKISLKKLCKCGMVCTCWERVFLRYYRSE